MDKKLTTAFLHIPKTGGTYLSQYETKSQSVIWPIENLGHSVFSQNKKFTPKYFPPQIGYKNKRMLKTSTTTKDYLVITIARNIFDWLVSYWGHAGGLKTKYTDVNHYDYKLAQKGFDKFVKEIATRNDPNIWPSKRFIHFSLFSLEGLLVPDWIARTSSLDKDLKIFANDNGLKYSMKKKQRVGRKSRDYKSFYNKELKDLVYNTWGRELKLFGFNFEGYDSNNTIIKNVVTNDQKDNIRYYYKTDSLEIDGKKTQ